MPWYSQVHVTQQLFLQQRWPLCTDLGGCRGGSDTPWGGVGWRRFRGGGVTDLGEGGAHRGGIEPRGVVMIQGSGRKQGSLSGYRDPMTCWGGPYYN